MALGQKYRLRKVDDITKISVALQKAAAMIAKIISPFEPIAQPKGSKPARSAVILRGVGRKKTG
jgi:hypothetical protein